MILANKIINNSKSQNTTSPTYKLTQQFYPAFENVANRSERGSLLVGSGQMSSFPSFSGPVNREAPVHVRVCGTSTNVKRGKIYYNNTQGKTAKTLKMYARIKRTILKVKNNGACITSEARRTQGNSERTWGQLREDVGTTQR